MIDQSPAGSGIPSGAVAPSVLWKAFDVLSAFNHKERVLTLARIARQSGLPKSTVHRVLAMLSDIGAVEQHEDGYRIGLRMFTLGALPPEAALREAAQRHAHDVAMVQFGAEFVTQVEPHFVQQIDIFGPQPRRMRTKIDENCGTAG